MKPPITIRVDAEGKVQHIERKEATYEEALLKTVGEWFSSLAATSVFWQSPTSALLYWGSSVIAVIG